MLVGVSQPEYQRMVAGAFVQLTKHEALREAVVRDGILPALSKMLRADAEDVKMMCSTVVRYLSHNAAIQHRMVEEGVLALLIDTMAVNEEGRRSPASTVGVKSGVLPAPDVAWRAGAPTDVATVSWLRCDTRAAVSVLGDERH